MTDSFPVARQMQSTSHMERRRFLQMSAAVLLPQEKPPAESVTATATQDRTPRVGVVLSEGPIWDSGLRKAIALGTTRAGGLPSIIATEDWVVIQTSDGADPRLVEAVQGFLKERGLGKRFTVVGPAELATADAQEMPVPGGERVCRIPKMILHCDRLLRVGPLMAAKAEISAQELVDRMSFHPPDYTIFGGHNVVVAGADPVAVESVAAQIVGLDPEKLTHLRLAADRGLGLWEAEAIWVQGNSVEEARRAVAGP